MSIAAAGGPGLRSRRRRCWRRPVWPMCPGMSPAVGRWICTRSADRRPRRSGSGDSARVPAALAGRTARLRLVRRRRRQAAPAGPARVARPRPTIRSGSGMRPGGWRWTPSWSPATRPPGSVTATPGYGCRWPTRSTRDPAGIPYLRPQFVLLGKAKHRRAKDEADLDVAAAGDGRGRPALAGQHPLDCPPRTPVDLARHQRLT